MADIPRATQDHYVHIQRVQLVALKAARRAWAEVDPNRISQTWLQTVERDLTPVITAAQVNAATAGSDYSAMTLAQQGQYVAPDAFVDPNAFGGYSADGYPIGETLAAPAYRAKALIGSGIAAPEAVARARSLLDTIVGSTVSDAARQSASVDIAARPGTSYVRMLNPPSCSRCTILAGRFYRWNKGFLRHPSCDCEHVITTVGSQGEAYANGLVDDPYEYFKSLPEAEQNKVFGKSSARSIRDGSDIYRVENAKRGASGLSTTAGTSKRGFMPNQKRLTPDGIYSQNLSREQTLNLLSDNGYILNAGQVPGGSIIGAHYEGFGALGRGGTRKGASASVTRAQQTGVRTPGDRYTATAAERRLIDSEARYKTALEGRNPYGKGPASPTDLATAETDYRRWLTSGGEIFTK